MAYTKTVWKNRIVENPNTYLQQQNADGTVTLIPKEGTVTEAGTPVNAVNMNNIENGIATVDTNLGNINDSTLDSSIKGKSLTNMIKVLFQNVDNGKNNVYSAIVGKGITPSSKDFADLVSGINAINTGKKYATGTINSGSTGSFTISGLNFKPKTVIFYAKNSSTNAYSTFGYSDEISRQSSYQTKGIFVYSGDYKGTDITGITLNLDGFKITYSTTKTFLINADVNWVAIE